MQSSVMQNTVVPTLDQLETVLLHLWDAIEDVKTYKKLDVVSGKTQDDDHCIRFFTSDDYYKKDIKTKKPSKPLFVGTFTNNERWFAGTTELLMEPAHELVNRQPEMVLYADGNPEITWVYFKQLNQRPYGYVPAISGNFIYYERHVRVMNIETNYTDYGINYFAWSPKLNRFFSVTKCTKDAHAFQKAAEECTLSFILHASAVEDSCLKQFFNVTIKCGIALTFYVDCKAVQELFKLRDNPLTANDRRRPIVHWVSYHLRRKPVSIGYAEIPEHLRGVTEFDFEGLNIQITSPVKEKNE